MRITGKVSWYNHRDGFGQLIDEAGTRYFFDKSVLKNISIETISTGVLVEFHLNPKIQKPLCATGLKLLSANQVSKKRAGKQLTLFETEIEQK